MNFDQVSHTGVGAEFRRPTFVFAGGQSSDKAGKSGMEFDSLGEIIAARLLHLVDEQGHKRPVSVFIGKPEPEEDSSGYKCPYQVIGIGSQKTHFAHGHDSIQALQAAMVLAGANLSQLNNEVGGRLVWNGGAVGELGFPQTYRNK